MSGRLGLGLISPFSSQEVTPAGTVAMNAPGAHNSARAAITAAAAAARQQQHCQEQLQGQRACQPADAHSALDEIDLDGILGMLVGGGSPVEEPVRRPVLAMSCFFLFNTLWDHIPCARTVAALRV